jgi:hypothetical protein
MHMKSEGSDGVSSVRVVRARVGAWNIDVGGGMLARALVWSAGMQE